MEYFHVRRPNPSPGVGVDILVLGDVHVQPPGAGHDVILLLLPLLRQAEAGQGRQQRAWLQRRGDSAAGGNDYLNGDMKLAEVQQKYS